MMRAKFILAFCLLAGTIECSATGPKRFSIPARRQGALGRRDANTYSTPSDDHVVVDFSFGGQQIPASIDTGSWFTYVASTLDTNSSEIDLLPALFNPNISSTYHDVQGSSWWSDGCGPWGNDVATCGYGTDVVSTAGLTANNMTFGIASHVALNWFYSGQAATIGLGRLQGEPEDWEPENQPFWLLAGSELENPYLFTANIYEFENGSFDFGYIDNQKYKGDITWAAMDTDSNDWNFNMTGFKIGNGSVQTVSTFRAVVDSGGPNIGLPSFITIPYFDSIGGEPSPGHSHTYPCSAYPPPDLTLEIQGGGTLFINGTFLVEPPDGNGEICNGRLDDSVQTSYNIGASVLDQKFVVFDHANSRVGFAEKRNSGDPEGNLPSGINGNSTTTATGASTATATSAPGAITATGNANPVASASGTTGTAGAPSASPSSSWASARSFDSRSESVLLIWVMFASIVAGCI